MNERSFIVKSYFAISLYFCHFGELPGALTEDSLCVAGDRAGSCRSGGDRRQPTSKHAALFHDFVSNTAAAA